MFPRENALPVIKICIKLMLDNLF
uniref:Uncharacterized protein n=1 Tax=Rhizophora mucronata TaxID=61149 RepID=A0A2P2N121_RHIMU